MTKVKAILLLSLFWKPDSETQKSETQKMIWVEFASPRSYALFIQLLLRGVSTPQRGWAELPTDSDEFRFLKKAMEEAYNPGEVLFAQEGKSDQIENIKVMQVIWHKSFDPDGEEEPEWPVEPPISFYSILD